LAVDRRLQPELRVFTSPGDRTRMSHDALTPERAEGLIVEGSGFIEAIAAEGTLRRRTDRLARAG
jgi:hypothetical protein